MRDYHARHLGGGLIALYRGDEEVREIGITPGWHFKDRDEFIARYNRDAALQSEKARADAAEALLQGAVTLFGCHCKDSTSLNWLDSATAAIQSAEAGKGEAASA